MTYLKRIVIGNRGWWHS